MVFFVPKLDCSGRMTPEESERVWRECREGAEHDHGAKALERRVYKLRFVRNGTETTATVGELSPYYEGECILAIVAFADLYMICGAFHGHRKIGGTPMVGPDMHPVPEDFAG
jgi:hypothetical protein